MISSPGPLEVVPIIVSTLVLTDRLGGSTLRCAGRGDVTIARGAVGSVMTSFVSFLSPLNRSASRPLFSVECPITQVRLSCDFSPLACRRLSKADSRSGKTGISSHIAESSSSLSARLVKARYSHARCCNSASSTCVYRSKILIRWSLISGNRLTH